MKTCGICKQELDESCFASHVKRGLQSNCKECQKQYRREHYLKNRQKYIDKAASWSKDFAKWWREYKSELKCERCAENHPACLHFHHTDDNKEGNVAKFVADGSKPKVLKEIEKCIVLCANCHAKLHDEERQNMQA